MSSLHTGDLTPARGAVAPRSRRRPGRLRPCVLAAALGSVVFLTGGAVLAHGTEGHGRKPAAAAAVVKEQKPWGIAGEAARATRVIEVSMSDGMRFNPATIEVREGETVRFVVRNAGRLMHEFVIGTREENAKHAELMKRFPNMAHDEPYMAHVDPGNAGEIVWTFNRAGEFEFACLVAGHYDAGMLGRIRVNARKAG